MKTQSAQRASYRVPTRDEIKAFVDCINLAVKVGHRVTYCESGHETVITCVLWLPAIDSLHIVCTDLFSRHRLVSLISVDSFAFEIPGSRGINLMTPSWLEGGAL